METNLSEEERRSTRQTKSKLDALSREDLIRFVKKQLDNARQSEIEAKKLKELLEEKELVIKDLLTKNASLKTTSHLEDNDVNFFNSVDKRSRIDDDLAAALQVNNELRSQLENVIEEAAALREQRTATDVFSLELKDYEKKMVQLNKSLKDAELALEASNVEKEELIQQLSNHKLSNDRINADCLTLQSELQEVRIRLHEEQCRVRELTSTVDKLQDNSNILLTTRNEERVTFEAKIARNEELLLYWQKISEQKSAELSDLLAENEMLRTRCHNLENDFISYKSRARYVLEQQAKAAVNGGAINGLNTEAVQQSLIQLMNDFEELHVAHRTVINDARKYREQCMRYESLNRSAKANALELQHRLMQTNEELLNCKVMLELRVSECFKYRSQLSSMEEKLQELLKAKEEALREIEQQLASRSVVEAGLTTELEKEKNRCEEAMRRLCEAQKERTRASSASPIYLHRSPSENLVESNPSAPRLCAKVSTGTLIDDEEQHERSLEDVLFGEDFMDPCCRLSVNKTLSSVTEKNEQLLKQLRHTRELLNDTEATNATLIDQSMLLKEEIRRLERNGERLNHFENSEYLKNVILKFLSPERVSGERVQLVPILATMLRLSPDETELLNRVASQDDVAHDETESTWGSYLRWGRLN